MRAHGTLIRQSVGGGPCEVDSTLYDERGRSLDAVDVVGIDTSGM